MPKPRKAKDNDKSVAKESLADVIRRLGRETHGENTRQVALAQSLWELALGSPGVPADGIPPTEPQAWATRALFEFLAGKPAQAPTPASETSKLKALEQVRDASRLNSLAGTRDRARVAQSPCEGGTVRSTAEDSDGAGAGSD